MIRRIYNRFWLELDALKWYWTTRELRVGQTDEPQKTLLIVALMQTFANARVEALFANTLRRSGYKICVLLPKPYAPLEHIYRSAGPVQFVYMESNQGTLDQKTATQEAEHILDSVADFSTLLKLAIDGNHVGRHALSWVTRALRVGKVKLDDPEHRRLIIETLAKSLRAKVAAEQIFEQFKPDLVLFVERGYTPAGEFFDTALNSGADTVQWLGSPQSDALLFKRYTPESHDVHPHALSDASVTALKQLEWTKEREDWVVSKLRSHYSDGAWYNRQQLQTGKSIKPPEEIQEQLGLDPSKKTAAIFAHILYDAAFFYGTNLYEDYEQWLVETVRGAIANPNLNWIIKLHPVNVWRSRVDGEPMRPLEVEALTAHFGTLPPHIKILPPDTDINTFSLFGLIDYGLTVRGTIGMELPCFGVPVVTAGTGRYSGHGFTVDAHTAEEYQEILARIHALPPMTPEQINLARRYAYGAFKLRLWKTESFLYEYDISTARVLDLETSIRLVHSEPQEMADLEAFRHWIAETRHLDFLPGLKPSH